MTLNMLSFEGTILPVTGNILSLSGRILPVTGSISPATGNNISMTQWRPKNSTLNLRQFLWARKAQFHHIICFQNQMYNLPTGRLKKNA